MPKPIEEAIAGLLYDGVLSPDAWYGAMQAFNEAVGGFKFHQLTVNHQWGCVLNSVASAHEAEAVDIYEKHHALSDERLPVVKALQQGQLMLDHEHFTARDMSRSAIYADWLASQGMRHTMVLMQRVEGSVQEYVGFMRAADQRPFGDEQRRIALQLMPHMLRASRLRAQTMALSHQAALGLGALDSLSQCLFVVDGECRIHYCNTAAERYLATHGPLGTVHGKLQHAPGDADERWRRLVAGACSSPGTAGLFELQSVPRQLTATVLPLNARHALVSFRQLPMALVILGGPAAPVRLDQGLLSDMLDLSPSETRLLLLVASGKTVKDYAQLEGCSWHTARTHMKNLMRKTGCHRQVELVGLLRSLGGV